VFDFAGPTFRRATRQKEKRAALVGKFLILAVGKEMAGTGSEGIGVTQILSLL
jgi:hypothetical protein